MALISFGGNWGLERGLWLLLWVGTLKGNNLAMFPISISIHTFPFDTLFLLLPTCPLQLNAPPFPPLPNPLPDLDQAPSAAQQSFSFGWSFTCYFLFISPLVPFLPFDRSVSVVSPTG